MQSAGINRTHPHHLQIQRFKFVVFGILTYMSLESSEEPIWPFPLHQVPALKAGVRILDGFDASAQVFIGTPKSGLLFSSPHSLSLLRNIDGQKSIRQIISLAQENDPVRALFLQALTDLFKAGLIELHRANAETANAGEANFEFESDEGINLDQSRIFLQQRIGPESQLASWNTSSNIKTEFHTGNQVIANRMDFPILIYGTKRLALTLLSLLQASGFSRTRIIAGNRSQNRTGSKSLEMERVQPGDIYGLVLRLSDIGARKSEVIKAIVQHSRLIPITEEMRTQPPKLVISTELPQPDFVQRWMSEGIPHLAISHWYESSIEIGPLVIPGNTPCLRCIALHKHGSNPLRNRIELSATLDSAPDLPAAAAAYVAGLVTLQVSEYADSGKSDLLATTIRHDFFRPCNPEHIYWQRHSLCGCFEVV